jgi:hypothetical protein
VASIFKSSDCRTVQLPSEPLLREAERLCLTDHESFVFLGPPYQRHRSPRDVHWAATVSAQKDIFQMMLCDSVLQDMAPEAASLRRHATLLKEAIERDRGETWLSSMPGALPPTSEAFSRATSRRDALSSRGTRRGGSRQRNEMTSVEALSALEEQEEADLHELLSTLGIPLPTLTGWLDKLNSLPKTPESHGPSLHLNGPRSAACSHPPAFNTHLLHSATRSSGGAEGGGRPSAGGGAGVEAHDRGASEARHGAADSDWRRRFVFVAGRALQYKSQKIGSRVVKLCDLASIVGAHLDAFAEAGRPHCVVLKTQDDGKVGVVTNVCLP